MLDHGKSQNIVHDYRVSISMHKPLFHGSALLALTVAMSAVRFIFFLAEIQTANQNLVVDLCSKNSWFEEVNTVYIRNVHPPTITHTHTINFGIEM